MFGGSVIHVANTHNILIMYISHSIFDNNKAGYYEYTSSGNYVRYSTHNSFLGKQHVRSSTHTISCIIIMIKHYIPSASIPLVHGGQVEHDGQLANWVLSPCGPVAKYIPLERILLGHDC